MPSLSDASRLVEAQDRWREALVQFAADAGPDPLLWAVLPALLRTVTDAAPAAGRPRLGSLARNTGRALWPGRGPALRRVGPVITVSTGAQTTRVLTPIVTELERDLGPSTSLALRPIRPPQLLQDQAHGARVGRAMVRHLARAGVGLPPGDLEDVTQAAILTTRARRLMADERPDLVLVATQHNSATRAVLQAAHEAGITTAYVPHAPVADNSAYNDLPFGLVMLRGPAEVDHYERQGARRELLAIVGDPSRPSDDRDLAPHREAAVYASSPKPTAFLEQVIEVISEAHLPSIEVSPHPRVDAQRLAALCPSSWTFNPLSSTFDRLASAGASALLQTDSGIGLEALSLGLPVINIAQPGRPPNYPYLGSEHVQIVHSSEALAAAHHQIDGSEDAAAHRRAYARTWCALAGPQAARRAAELVEDALGAPPPPSLALDTWAHLR